jgi:phytoene dehydrogenase-like protein
VLVAGEPRHEIAVKHFGFDPSLAPAAPLHKVAGLPTVGKSVVEVIIRSDYAYWQRIYGRRVYDEEQRQVSQILLDHLEQWHPGINAEIEVVDEATPLSYERYTGNWKGSTCGWLLCKETMPMMINGVPKTLPGLGNLYMAGQWVEPGGTVSMAAASGRNVIQMMCVTDDKEFRAEMP